MHAHGSVSKYKTIVTMANLGYFEKLVVVVVTIEEWFLAEYLRAEQQINHN